MPERQQKEMPKRLLHDRTQTGYALGGLSYEQIRRIEKMGILKPVKLSRGPTAKTYYTDENIRDVAARGLHVLDHQETQEA